MLIIQSVIDAKPLAVTKSNPKIGEHIYNIAAPLGLHAPNMALMFDGYYEGNIKFMEEKHPYSLYNLVGVGGSSGSPIFNDDWEIIGIISRGVPEFQSVMLGVSQERVKLFYDYSFSSEFKIKVLEAKNKIKQKFSDKIKEILDK